MCGRLTLAEPDLSSVARKLGAEVDPKHQRLYRPRWNLAPTDEHWLVRLHSGRKALSPARFGVKSGEGRLVFNARSETADRLPLFREAFRSRRCLVPADGFYEWKGQRGSRRPLWFHAAGGGLLLFAGLSFAARGELEFVILTTAANDLVAPVHDRMPVVLSIAEGEAWLARPEPALLVPAPAGALVAREASALVNSVANDGPELLVPPPPEPQLKLW